MTTTNVRTPTIDAVVGVAHGGIAINWQKLELPKPEFTLFLRSVLRAGGFRMPQQVTFERNKVANGKPAVDYRRLRIPADECQMNLVVPERAVIAIKEYLRSDEPAEQFGIRFRVA